MAFDLKQFLQGSVAQINPWYGGKTYASVMNTKKTPAVVATTRPMSFQEKMAREQAAKIPQFNLEMDRIYQKKLPSVIENEKRSSNWLERLTTDSNWEQRAKDVARTQAIREYQDKFGYNKDPNILNEQKNVARNMQLSQRDSNNNNKLAEDIFKAAAKTMVNPTKSYVFDPVTFATEKLLGKENPIAQAQHIAGDTYGNFVAGGQKALLNIPGMVVETAGTIGDIFTPDTDPNNKMFQGWSNTGREMNSKLGNLVDKANGLEKGDTESFWGKASQGAGAFAADVGLGLLGGGATKMLKASPRILKTIVSAPQMIRAATGSFNDVFNQAKKNGKSDQSAASVATAVASVNALLERLGGGEFFGNAGSKQITKRLIASLSEGGEEWAQNLVENAARMWYEARNYNLGDINDIGKFIGDLTEGGLEALASGTLIGAFGDAVMGGDVRQLRKDTGNDYQSTTINNKVPTFKEILDDQVFTSKAQNMTAKNLRLLNDYYNQDGKSGGPSYADVSRLIKYLGGDDKAKKAVSMSSGRVNDSNINPIRFDRPSIANFIEDKSIKAVDKINDKGIGLSIRDVSKDLPIIGKDLSKEVPAITPEVGKTLDSLNPTGGLYVDYSPIERATMPLGKNLTTFDKTSGKSPNEMVTIYRGVDKKYGQKGINPGDFVTTLKELAKSYTGDGNIIEMKVPAKHILDDITEPLGDEYIYRPGEQTTVTQLSPERVKAILKKEKQSGFITIPGDKTKVSVKEVPAITPEVSKTEVGNTESDFNISEKRAAEALKYYQDNINPNVSKDATVSGNLIDSNIIYDNWGSEKPIKLNGNTYTVHKMSYGQYFLEPSSWNGGERNGMSPGTKWLKLNKDGEFEVIGDDDFMNQGVIQDQTGEKITSLQPKPEVPAITPEVGKVVTPEMKLKQEALKYDTFEEFKKAREGKELKDGFLINKDGGMTNAILYYENAYRDAGKPLPKAEMLYRENRYKIADKEKADFNERTRVNFPDNIKDEKLQSLKSSAKKYNKLEDFINSFGQTVYRGTNKVKGLSESLDTDYGPGYYFADSKDTAGSYGKTNEYIVKMDNPFVVANRYKMNDVIDSFLNKRDSNETKATNIREYLQEKGYDGILVKDGSMAGRTGAGQFRVAFTPDQIATRQQLTDIYNQSKPTPQPKTEVPALTPPKTTPELPRQTKVDSATNTAIEETASNYKTPQEYRNEMVDLIWQNNKKGKGVEFIMNDNQYEPGFDIKRISNNTPFYREFFAEYGRKPTKKEITNLVDEYLNGQDNLMKYEMMPEERDVFNAIKDNADALDRLQIQEPPEYLYQSPLERLLQPKQEVPAVTPTKPVTPELPIIGQRLQNQTKAKTQSKQSQAKSPKVPANQGKQLSKQDTVLPVGVKSQIDSLVASSKLSPNSLNDALNTPLSQILGDIKAEADPALPTFNAVAAGSKSKSTKKLTNFINQDAKITKAAIEAQNTGKEINFFAKKDANDRGVGIERFNPKTHKIEAGFVVDQDGNILGNHIKVDDTGIQVNVGGDLVNMEQVIGNPNDWKGKYRLTDTPSRVIDSNAPNKQIAQTAKDYLVGSKVKAEANFRTELEIQYKDLGKRIKTVESARPSNVTKKAFKDDIFSVLNGDKTDANIRSTYDAKTAKVILDYKKQTRALYDSLLVRINKERVKFGQSPIDARKDYITHLQEMNGSKSFVGEVIEGARNSFTDEGTQTTRGSVPGQIAGRTENFKPISAYNKFLQRRKGTKSLRDPFLAVQEYLEPALYNIHMTEPTARARAVEAAFRTAGELRDMTPDQMLKQTEKILEPYKNSGDNSKLVAGFQEYANTLAKKTNRIDRVVIDLSQVSATGMKAWTGLQRVGGQATILGNVSSVLAQPLNQVVGIADAGPVNYMKGIARSLGDDNAINQSNFIKARRVKADKPIRSVGKKILDAGAIPLEVVETASIEVIWNSQHAKAQKAGYKGAEAIKQADYNTERLVAGRGIGDKPEVYRSRLSNGLLEYTLEVNAQNKVFWKDLNTKQKATFLVAAAGTNALMGAITGFEPLPDFLKAAIDTGSDLLDDEDDRGVGEKLLEGGQRILGEYASMNPVISASANAFMPQDMRKAIFGSESDLGRFEGTAAPVQVVKNVYKAADNAIKGNWTEARNDILRTIPFGNQARKSITGAEANARGYAVDKSGKPTYATSDSIIDKVKNFLFGPSADPNAREYYANNGRPLSDLQAETLKSLEKNEQLDYLKSITEERAENKQNDKEIERLNKGSESETKTLKSGKVAYKNADGEWKIAKDQKSADIALKKSQAKKLLDEFEDSDKNYEVKDGLVYRRKEDGTAYTTPQNKFESQVRKQQLQSLKATDDVAGWLITAEAEAKDLIRQLNDPNVDPLDRFTIENDIRSLIENIAKYKNYGGFTKPKKAKKAKEPKEYKGTPRTPIASRTFSELYGDSYDTSSALRKLLQNASTIKRKVIK